MADVVKRNPDSPVLNAMDGQWAKIVALLLYQAGVREMVIPTDVVNRATADPMGLNVAIQFDDARGVILLLVGDDEAKRLARKGN